jgi:hypothetical protein
MNVKSLRPSPAFVIATLALVVALGGTAYATTKISGSQIKKHSIPGNRMKNNTLTGTQIRESKLGKVPNAKHADSATKATNATNATNAGHAGSASSVNGNDVDSFSVTVAKDGASQDVSLPGINLSGNCPSGATNLDAIGTEASAESYQLNAIDAGTITGVTDNSFSSTHGDNVSPESSTSGTGTVVVTHGSNLVTTITVAWVSNADQSCTYSGTAIASGA